LELDVTWRNELLPASFRDAAFFIQGAQTQVGRRTALHEYPQRDDAFSEDLGQKADQFSIEAIVIGPDYFKARDALIAALKERGPGTLTHPWYGQRTVALASPARIAESPDEGGLARFTLEFVECGAAPAEPHAREDTQGAVDAACDEALAAAEEDFIEAFSVEGLPEFAVASALDLAQGAIGQIGGMLPNLLPDASALSDFASAAQQASGQIAALVRAPAAYAQSVLGLIGAVGMAARSPQIALLSYRGLWAGSSSSPVASPSYDTPVRQREAANATAQTALVRRAALIESARAASAVDFTSYDDAIAARDELAARLDDEGAGMPPAPAGAGQPVIIPVADPVYQALTAVRVALVRDLSARAVDAPRLSSAVLPATLPALVVAYRLLGDATQDAGIVARNRVRHPGFVPGGVPLEFIAP
jgi:prophage DNA circulation protein